jgi:hypothetical protein
MTVMMMLAQE